jgi:GTP-binding protein HflX
MRGVIDEERYEAEGTLIAGRLPVELVRWFEPFSKPVFAA